MQGAYTAAALQVPCVMRLCPTAPAQPFPGNHTVCLLLTFLAQGAFFLASSTARCLSVSSFIMASAFLGLQLSSLFRRSRMVQSPSQWPM